MVLHLEVMWRDLHLVILLDTTSEPGRTNPKARRAVFRRFDVPRLVRWPPKDGQPELTPNRPNPSFSFNRPYPKLEIRYFIWNFAVRPAGRQRTDGPHTDWLRGIQSERHDKTRCGTAKRWNMARGLTT